MKWYEDMLVWLVLLLLAGACSIGAFYVGREYVVDSCKNYGAYIISKEEGMLCFVKTIHPVSNTGEKAYVPEAKEFFQKGKTT